VKGILLQNLIESSLTVMRAAANAIAQIAAIEISRGEWLEIINSLAANSMHAQLAVRRASITTLGFICEELRLAKSNIKRETCEQILGSLLLGLQESGELVEISLTALRESICFLRDILENKSYCDKVFEYLFPFLNTDYRGKIYEILFEFGRYCYHLLGDYLSPIGEITLQHIQQRNDNAILALEFWDTVGTEYIKRVSDSKDRIHSEKYNVRNFVKELHHLLLPEVMASILILDASDLDLPEIREGAVKTLGTFVNCCGRELVDKVTEGVSRVIASPNAGERQASALLFSCLCEYPDRYYVEECFSNGFVHLYKLIDDSEVIVRKNTLNGFVTLAESFPEVFLRNKDITAIFDHLINLSTNSDEDVQILSLSILTSITDVLKEFPCSISS
jgi:importin subunit beta-1